MNRRVMAAAIFVLGGIVFAQIAKQTWTYRQRDGRYEGVQPKPLPDEPLVLLSLLADGQRPAQPAPDSRNLILACYPHQAREVDVVIRETDNRHHYRLDRVDPNRFAKVGNWLQFTWPRADVLGTIRLGADQLGAVVRPKPAAGEPGRILPAILGHGPLPTRITEYRFTFQARADCRLGFAVYCAGTFVGGDAPDKHRPLRRAGRPITFRWDCSAAPEGDYLLQVKGDRVADRQPLALAVQFYHRPDVN